VNPTVTVNRSICMNRANRICRVTIVFVLLGMVSCKDRPAPAKAVEVPAEVDALAVANATGTPVIAPAILEDTDEPQPEPDPVDAGPIEPVKLVLQITPVSADVFWGGKRIGVSKAGEPLILTRPRSSGPLDLTIRAPGFLPYHTRLYTDRDDKLNIGLRRGSAARTQP
jgi:hypothetical protein